MNVTPHSPKYPLLPLLLCLGLFYLVCFGDLSGLPSLTALAWEKDLETMFTDLGRSLEEGDLTAVFAPQPAANLFTPPSLPSSAPSSAPIPSVPPSSPALPTPSPTPDPPSSHPVPPSSHPYSGPELPANATMDYVDLGLESTENPTFGGYTSPFGWRDHPLSGTQSFHRGVDISAAVGTDVHAFADGTILAANWEDSYGYYIKIQHSEQVVSVYAHCSQLLKNPGDTVKAGDVVAKSGATGKVTGPHLHFELWVNSVLCDPSYYLTLS